MDSVNLNSQTKHDVLSCLTILPKSNKNTVAKEPEKISCLKCDLKYELPKDLDNYLGHLFLDHRLVIADVEDISDLNEYFKYWSNEFKGHDLDYFCTTMLLDQLPDGTPSRNEKYYLLSDILPKDDNIRKKLHMNRLQRVLAQYQFERTDRTFCRECMHCRDVIKGARSDFLEHLYGKHFFHLGKAENLVYVDELLNVVQNKLENLICLYCEKIFKDRSTLKEHMRKKGHKRINPELRFYDKFFLINYKTEKPKRIKNCMPSSHAISKKYQPFQETKETNRNIVGDCDDDCNWSDWEGESRPIKCLFCDTLNQDLISIKQHMLDDHEINFDLLINSLTFYEKVKVVNFLRRQMHILQCPECNQRFEDQRELEKHLKDEKHYSIGNRKQWDKPEFFFPTYEDDEMLCHLDDEFNEDLDKSPVIIYSEDTKNDKNEEAEKLSLENFALNVSKLL